MVYQTSNPRVMSKSIQVTTKQSQSHQLQHEDNSKRMLSPTKSSACASQHQSHHSRQMANEYVNVKSQCRRDSQTALQNPKHSNRCETSSGHQVMPSATKSRNDYKSDMYQQETSNDCRHNNESRHNNTAPMTDIYADDLAEVKCYIKITEQFTTIINIQMQEVLNISLNQSYGNRLHSSRYRLFPQSS